LNYKFTIYILSILLVISKGTNAAQKPVNKELPDVNLIAVKGVFFVPKNCAEPTKEDIKTLNRHMSWSRMRYFSMLNERDTFEISRTEIYHSRNSLDYYRANPDNGAGLFIDELFKHYGCNRKSCPYIFVIIIANDKDNFPKAGGRSFNGGLNLGGGMVMMPLYLLRNSEIFQSTLRHELGHSFGLVHPEAYAYDMNDNHSIMSYNEKHYTKFFKESDKPGILIPEDICALAANKRVFGKLTFDLKRDVPQGYKMHRKIIIQGPMDLPEEKK